jgi:16S rRNA (guanine966-N2)-methyltransferase
MRIIGGRFRGHRLQAPRAGARPTTDRVREALFNLLASRTDLEGERVLDLFAGSGALGLEALSRGAAEATFVEQHGPALATIRANASALGVEANCRLVRGDAFRFLETASGDYAVIFADPPYDLAGVERLPDAALARLAPAGIFALEHDRGHDFDDHAALLTSRAYGRSVISLFGSDP